MEEKEFTEGQEVEIQGGVFNKDPDSWYTAKVIEFLNNNTGKTTKKKSKKIRIEYKRLMDKQGLRMRETVDVNQVRPPPPPMTCAFFQVNQLVDAFIANGWWKGKITGVLGVSSYAVSMFSSDLINPQMEVRIDDLRVHQDWIGGRWFIPLPQHHHQEIKQQIDSVGKETTTPLGRTGGQSDEMVSEASTKGVSPDNRLESQSSMSITIREASLKGHRVRKLKCSHIAHPERMFHTRTTTELSTRTTQEKEGAPLTKTDKYRKLEDILQIPSEGLSDPPPRMKTDKYRKLDDILQSDNLYPVLVRTKIRRVSD